MSQKHRDQASNVDDCLEKLKEILLSVAVAPTIRRPTKPTLGSQIRRVDGKKETGKKKAQRKAPDIDY